MKSPLAGLPAPAAMRRRRFLQSAALATAAFGYRSAASGRAATHTKRIQLDSDGMLRVGGQREFVLGLYQVPEHPAALREAAEAGFNLIHRPATRAALDEARAVGLGAWTTLGALPETDRPTAEAKLRATIETLRNHPSSCSDFIKYPNIPRPCAKQRMPGST